MSTIHEKLIAVQSSLSVPKGQMNKFGGYKYRSCEDILEAVKPLLKEQGLVLTLSDEIVFFAGNAPQHFVTKEPSKDGKSTIEKSQFVGGDRFYVKATAMLSARDDADPASDAPYSTDLRYISVTAYAREEETKKGMDGSQITGAASSYARKYALNGLFCIDDTKDSDATNTHDKEEPKAKPKTPPQPVLAAPDVVQHILDLCAALNKDEKAMWEHYKVIDGKPTKEAADKIVAQLYAAKRNLDKELTALSQ